MKIGAGPKNASRRELCSTARMCIKYICKPPCPYPTGASPTITHRPPINKMYKQPLRTASSSLARVVSRRPTPRRFLTTAPPHQTSRSWKNSAIRWGLAGTLLYYYNTSNAFAEEPACMRTCSGILCLCHLANAHERLRPLAT